MRAFVAFFKKELFESIRNGKLLILFILFFAFGIMNPAIAKLTPWILDMLGEELAESGMAVTGVTVDAITSWVQFFKNIPMALIAFVLLYGGTFTKEYESGTLILVLTKGLARYKVVLAKALMMVALWSAGYWLCFGVTYGYNAYFWDNSIATGLMPAVLNWWLFGLFAVVLPIFFSVIAENYGVVMLLTGGCVFTSYLLSLVPKLTEYLPTSLMNSSELLVGAEEAEVYLPAVIITAAISLALVAVSVPIFNKKQL